MRKTLYALMLIVILLCVRSNYKIIESHSNTIKYLNQSVNTLSDVVLDRVEKENVGAILSKVLLKANVVITNGFGHGSGVAIKPNLILTAGHCVDHNDLYILDIDGNEYEIIKTWRSTKYDIAFVLIDAELPCLGLGEMPELLDTVYAIGSPYGKDYATTVTKGIISHLNRDVYNRVGLIQADAECAPGSSGGALLDERLYIVGICICGPRPGGGVVCFEPITHIKECLDEYLKCQKQKNEN